MPNRRAPVQRSHSLDKPEGSISWAEHVEAWMGYARRYGTEQSAQRIAERGGFSYWELVDQLGHVPLTWEPSGNAEARAAVYAARPASTEGISRPGQRGLAPDATWSNEGTDQ